MPYAADGQISKRPIDGGVKISDEKYDEARNHALSGGLIKVHGKSVILTSKPEKKEGHEEPVWQDGDWHHEPLPEKTQAEKDAELIRKVESQRKSEEDKGVTINNVRYSGSEKNRSALQEAITYLKDSGGTAFPTWKDSDDKYHVDHPLKDVEDALRAIGVRRMALISKESEHVRDVLEGTIEDTDNLDWSV